MRKHRNNRAVPQPALVWNHVAAAYRLNRAARRSAGQWGWRFAAVQETQREYARAVSLLLTGKESVNG